jgi:SAM-dependent methyltransferase
VDVDWQAIDWCGANLPGRYHLIQPAGRLPFDDRTFRAAYAFNVFTHLGEHEQVDRLSEIHRVLNPGGALIVTTRPPELLAAVSEVPGRERQSLRERGFAFFTPAGSGDFNDRLAFQSREYLRDTWAPWFRLTDYRRAGFRRRDVAIFERHAGPSCARVRRMRWNRKVRLRGKAAS